MPTSAEMVDYYVFGVVVVLAGLLSCSALYLNKTCSDDAYALLQGDEDGAEKNEAETEALVKAAAANKSPFDEASILNRWLFSWLSPLLRVGYRTPLQAAHMLALPQSDRCDSVAVPFEETWRAEKSKFHPKLWRAFVKSFGVDFAFGGGWKVLQDLLIFAGPLVLKGLVQFFSDPTAPTSRGVLLALVLFVSATTQSLFLHKYFYDMFRVSLRVRTALVVLIYKKAFVLSNAARQKNTVGEIVNHQSTDVKRISDLIPYLHVLWSSPLQIIISLILLFQVKNAALSVDDADLFDHTPRQTGAWLVDAEWIGSDGGARAVQSAHREAPGCATESAHGGERQAHQIDVRTAHRHSRHQALWLGKGVYEARWQCKRKTISCLCIVSVLSVGCRSFVRSFVKSHLSSALGSRRRTWSAAIVFDGWNSYQ